MAAKRRRLWSLALMWPNGDNGGGVERLWLWKQKWTKLIYENNKTEQNKTEWIKNTYDIHVIHVKLIEKRQKMWVDSHSLWFKSLLWLQPQLGSRIYTGKTLVSWVFLDFFQIYTNKQYEGFVTTHPPHGDTSQWKTPYWSYEFLHISWFS